MIASNTLYPSLNRFFKNQTEFAHAGCMSRTRLNDCLNGKKEFTRSEKKAIAANIVVKIMNQESINYTELERAVSAWQGHFDDIYKITKMR